jgi:hypothetical protein
MAKTDVWPMIHAERKARRRSRGIGGSAVGDGFAVRPMDRTRRARPHDGDGEDDAARLFREDDQVGVQLQEGSGQGHRHGEGQLAGRHPGPVQGRGRLEKAPSGTDGQLAGGVDRPRRRHPPSARHPHVYPTDAVVQVADFYKGSNLIIGAKKRIEGLRLRATDTDWSHGDGPEVSGPIMSLVMAMTGREVTDLAGDGVTTLASRR